MKLQKLRSGSMSAGYALAFLGALVASGCGSSGGNLAEVTGTVTLDGEPVKGAIVQFIPQVMGGSTSFGLTDGKGHYKMAFSSSADGVMLGKSEVIVSSDDNVVVAGKPYSRTEVFPTKYNRETELTAEVEPGSNEIDFECESDEQSRQAMSGKPRRVTALEDQGL